MKQQKVAVGQIWQDWDIRWRKSFCPNRFFEIKSISGDGLYATCKNIQTGKMTKIRVDRFKPNSTGYRLSSN